MLLWYFWFLCVVFCSTKSTENQWDMHLTFFETSGYRQLHQKWLSLWWNTFFKYIFYSLVYFFILRLFALLKLLHTSVIQSDLQKCGHLHCRYQKLDDGNPIPGTWHVHSCYFLASQVCLNSRKGFFLSTAWTSACLVKLLLLWKNMKFSCCFLLFLRSGVYICIILNFCLNLLFWKNSLIFWSSSWSALFSRKISKFSLLADLAMQLNQGKFEYNGSCG